MEPTAEQFHQHLEKILPRTCVALSARLRKWLDDATLNDEAYALIQFARVFIEQVHLHAGETGDLLLLQARVGILNHVMAEMKEVAK